MSFSDELEQETMRVIVSWLEQSLTPRYISNEKHFYTRKIVDALVNFLSCVSVNTPSSLIEEEAGFIFPLRLPEGRNTIFF